MKGKKKKMNKNKGEAVNKNGVGDSVFHDRRMKKIGWPLMTRKAKHRRKTTYTKFLRGEKLNLMPPAFFPGRNNLSYAVSLAILFPRAGYDVLRS